MLKRDKDWETIKNLLLGKPFQPTTQLKLEEPSTKVLNNILSMCSVEQKLHLLRGIFGSSYRVQLRVTGENIEFEGLGEYTIEPVDKKSFG